mmetsp:Transcript_34494/g.39901  ORF Transcript_34494/g.39901 Transcript_34494/m.39901 type:complete len:389 (-) Transcript_34494:299-1465(-)
MCKSELNASALEVNPFKDDDSNVPSLSKSESESLSSSSLNEWEYADNYNVQDETGLDYSWDYSEEPHRSRRMEILKKYPQVQKLFGYEWKTKYMVGGTVLLQTYLSIAMRDSSWPLFLLVIYVVGATANHSIFLAIHEWSHDLGFKKPLHNKIGSVFANLPIGIPYSGSFKPYHMDHHRAQGVDGMDTDIPHPFEANIVRNRTVLKALFMLTQLAFYALRPSFIKPLAPNKIIAFNLAVQLTYDFTLVYFYGPNTLLYLLLSTIICGGFHPTAGHFLSEHLEVVRGIETYSYYGRFNYVTYNVGYHNEHHDFPKVPWSRLPTVKLIAAEYYDTLPVCECWIGIIWDYVTNPKLGAYSRVKRMPKEHQLQQLNKSVAAAASAESDKKLR